MNVFSIWAETALLQAPGGNKSLKAWRPTRNKTSKGRTVEPVTLYALRAGDKRLLGTFDVGPDPEVHEIEVDLLPGEQIQPDAARLFRSRPGFTGNPDATEAGTPGIAYRWMEVEGPIVRQTPPPTDLRAFMARAYRRPPREEEVQRYLKIAKEQGIVAGTPPSCVRPDSCTSKRSPARSIRTHWRAASRTFSGTPRPTPN